MRKGLPVPQAAEQPGLQPEEPLALQDIPKKRYPTRNRQAPRYLADFVTK